MRTPRTIRRRGRRRGAFTLIELLIVIAIIVIGVTLLIPAFGGIIESVSYSSAVNTVTAALGNARSLAVRNRRHTAVAFYFDVEREITSVQVLELNGQLGGSLSSYAGPPLNKYAFVYRPAANQTVVELPRGLGVYGLSFLVDPPGAQSYIDSDTAGWYAGWMESPNTVDQRPLWIFPQSDPRLYMPNDPPNVRFIGVDPWRVLAGENLGDATVNDARDAVRHAQTFVVQFAPDGSVVSSPSGGAATTNNVYVELPNEPIARRFAADPEAEPYDDPNAFDPENIDGARTSDPDWHPSGQDDIVPNPEVRARSVAQLAIVDLGSLSENTGVQRPWFVRPVTTEAPQPNWLDDLGAFPPERLNAAHRLISEWIDDNAEVISFSRYTGKIIKRSPS